MGVCRCGCSIDDNARFCRDCGQPLTGTQTDHANPLLLDHNADVPVERVVTYARSGRSVRLSLIAIGLVLVVGWGVFAQGSGEETGAADPIGDTAADPGPEGPEATGNDDGSTDATEPTADEPGLALIPLGEDERSTTPSPPGSSVGGAGPLVGQPTGYDLVVSTTGRPAVVDLDGGTVRHHDGDRVFPAVISGSWLVIERSTQGVARLPLDDLEADPSPLFAAPEAFVVTLASGWGQVDPERLVVDAATDIGGQGQIESQLYLGCDEDRCRILNGMGVRRGF